MAYDPELDDELEDDPKKKPQPIGKPITGPQQPAGASMVGKPIAAPPVQSSPAPAPEVPQQQAPAMPSSIGSPISVSAPMTPKPQYHGLARLADSIAGATKIGSAIEGASGLGTVGWRQKNADEQGQIEQGQEQRQANATTENVGEEAQLHGAETAQKEAQTAEIGKTGTATINGVTYTVPQKDLEKLIGTGVTQAGATQRTSDTNKSREGIASENNDSREDIATGKNRTAEDVANIHGRATVDAAHIRGTQVKPQTMYVPQPDGTYQAIAVSPGTTVPAGTQTASGVNTMGTPDSQSRAMGSMARSVLDQIPRIKDEVKNLKDRLGPAAGRWNEAYVNGLGANDPDFAGLDSDLDLLASAVVRTHFGAKGGQGYREALKKQFGEAQSPEDLIARIDHADQWIQGYAKMGQHGGAGAPPPASGGSVPRFGDFIKGQNAPR